MDLNFLNSVSSSSRRIYTEFNQIKPIDKGGFGRIYSAVSKIDLQTYAIKNVMINDKKISKKECNNTLNELRILSQFHHRNIVRYHTAWIEQIDNTNLNENEQLSSLSLSSSSRTNESLSNYQLESNGNLCSTKNKETEIDEDYSFNPCSNEEFSNSSNPREIHENHGIPDSEKGSNNGVNKVDFALYIQMELCQLNLKDWLFIRNKLPGDLLLSDQKNVQSLAQQLLEGVNYIHINKVMHRDIKPANIFLKHASYDNLQLKIGDFGLSKIFEYDIIEEMSTPSNFRWTANIGTPFYSAPEVINSKHKATTYNHKCDLYSVGIILVELMAKFKTFSELFHAITDLSNGRMLDELKEMWPLEAPHIMNLTSIYPTTRPEANFILNQTLSFTKFN